jgi:hypothetical protein
MSQVHYHTPSSLYILSWVLEDFDCMGAGCIFLVLAWVFPDSF